MFAELDFAALRRIEEALSSAVLHDLVAIFSQTSDDRLLLVYNTEAPPESTADNSETVILDDLGEVDLEQYDGLLAGISALDVIRSACQLKNSWVARMICAR